MKKLLIGAIPVVMVLVTGFVAYLQVEPTQISLPTFKAQVPINTTPAVASQPQASPPPSIDDPTSLWVIANKQRPLPYNYRPSLTIPHIRLQQSLAAESMQVSSVAAPDLERMFQSMQHAGLQPVLVSGFRSAPTQKQLYENYVAQYGQAEADRFSARPGTSEHQTGLAIDVGRVGDTCTLDACFGTTAEGLWLAAHAHEYGFIVRYPDGKEHITGYKYEPWHLRYVGGELATTLFSSGKTMEEHFNL